MYLLLFKNFIRTASVKVALVVILLMGIISIFIGRQFLEKQEKAIAKVGEFQKEHIDRNVSFISDDMGLLLYYLRFGFINKPNKMSALSIGQRDVNPSIQAVTIRGLEGQKYDTDLNNPSNLQSGNLDLGFVIIYLFPLLMIAFTFNLFSEEKEGGTWHLLQVQFRSAFKYLLAKLLTRAVLLYVLLMILFLIAIMVLSLEVSKAFTAFALVSFLYLTFWFVLSFWIVSFRKSSSFNILALLSVWLVLTILLPAGINNYITVKYPVPEALSTFVKQRDGYHEKWDMEKKVTMTKFYSHYPQYKKFETNDKGFNWLWYYAMQQMGDDDASKYSNEMSKKINQRNDASYTFAMAIPSMYTQLLFNDLAQTSLDNHSKFLKNINTFHENLRLYFYPKIFGGEQVKNVNWNEFKPEYFSTSRDISWANMLSPLLIITAIFMMLTLINFYKGKL